MAEQIVGMTALQRRIAAISGPATGKKVMTLVGMSAVREAKLLVARKTGNLGRSIHLEGVSDTGATLVASARYAAFVEYGTKAHDITPRVAKVLAWAPGAAGGAFRRLSGAPRKGTKTSDMIFAMRVHHPGTKPEPFLLPGARKAVEGSGLSNIVINEWNGAA